jgi:hypothetical protein
VFTEVWLKVLPSKVVAYGVKHIFSHGFSGSLQLLQCPQSDCEVSKAAGLP